MVRVCVGWLCVLVMTAAVARGAERRTPSLGNRMGDFSQTDDRPMQSVPLRSVPILKHVLGNSKNYRIENEVVVDGYYYRFRVTTDRGDYEAVSVRELIKLCRELDMIEHFRQEDEGGHVMHGVSRSAKGIGVGFKNIFVHPGQTVKRVGQGAGRFARATGGFVASPFSRKVKTESSDGSDRSRLGRGPAGGERRRLAHEMGIDVYTRNPEAQELLNEVARKRLAGSLPLSASVFALPGGAIFTLSLTPMGYDPSIEERIRDHDPTELKRLIGLWYEKEYGLDATDPDGPVLQLLENPNYSPREQAYLWRYLNDMKGVEGVEKALAFLAKQKTVERASIVSAQIEMLALLHTRARRLKQFFSVRNTLGALTTDNTLCLIISIDTVRFWSDVRKSLQLSIDAAKAVGARRIEIWSTGDVDKASSEYAGSQGVYVYQNILKNPIFRRPRRGVEKQEAPKVGAPKKAVVQRPKSLQKKVAPTAPLSAETGIRKPSAAGDDTWSDRMSDNW